VRYCSYFLGNNSIKMHGENNVVKFGNDDYVKSDVYHLLPMCHLQVEVKMRV
jgi:hypothetical protein